MIFYILGFWDSAVFGFLGEWVHGDALVLDVVGEDLVVSVGADVLVDFDVGEDLWSHAFED